MNIKHQLTSLNALVRHEFLRMFRMSVQVFLPPVITTLLYFLIFGSVVGERVGSIHGFNYMTYIAPGLVMIALINNAYANVCSSLFSARFQKSIEEILISPMHYSVLLLGYTLGGILRGVIVTLLVLVVTSFFIPIEIKHLPLTLMITILVAALFSLAGFTNGMLARNFEDIVLIPTFILTPLTYLGGVFFSVDMLSPVWQRISDFNPILYMVGAMRHVMIGAEGMPMLPALLFICSILLALTTLNLILLKRGVGIRN